MLKYDRFPSGNYYLTMNGSSTERETVVVVF